MKNFHITCLLVFSILFFAACKKDSNPTPPPDNSPVHMARIQQGIDPDITNDTVYLLSYDTSGKITMLVDSLDHDTLVAGYDASGNLTSITDKGVDPMNAAFTYDGGNHLTQMDYTLAGSAERYTFDYTDGVVSKKSYWSNLGSGSLKLKNYYTYTLSGGNISTLKYYTSGGIHLVDATVTYGSQTNPFKTLALFNFGNRLGLQDIAPTEAFFNTDIAATISSLGMTATAANTFDSKQQLTQIVIDDQINNWLLTWQFTFK